MNDNENKKAPEALPDEALDKVSGGMDLAALCGCICEDCGLADVESVHRAFSGECPLYRKLYPCGSVGGKRRGKGKRQAGTLFR